MRGDAPPPVVFTSPTWRLNGVNVFAARLARGLLRRGLEARIVLTDPERPEPAAMAPPPEVPLVPLPVGVDSLPATRWRALRRLLEGTGGCVYFPGYDQVASAICPTLSNRIVTVGVIHGDDEEHYLHLDRLGRYWNAVVAVTRRITGAARARAPGLGARLRTIPNGVVVPPVMPVRPERGTETLRIVYAGTLKQHLKRVFDLPLIVERLATRGVPVEVTVAGAGPDGEALRRRATPLVEHRLMRFVGVLDPSEIGELLAGHDVLLLTSESEGMPQALLEGMANGCVPVVTAVGGAVAELVDDGANGFVVPVGSIDAFADCLGRLQRDSGLRRRLGAEARTTIAAGPYTLGRMVDAYAELIEEARAAAARGAFVRPRGPVRPPPWLGPRWKHYLPAPVRTLGRSIKGRLGRG